jgi:hypothetical protein
VKHPGAIFEHTILPGAIFAHTVLPGHIFAHTVLPGAIFAHMYFHQCCLSYFIANEASVIFISSKPG